MSAVLSELQARLGLAVDPFAPQALPDFFFVGGQRRFLAQRAVHALYFSGGVVLLSGPRGAGKSRMLEEVVGDLRDLADTCRIDATVMMDGAEVRRIVAAKLGLAPAVAQDNAGLVAALAHWQPAGREPHPIALIVDDAHLLAVPALAECLQLARSSGGRLRLLLAGEPDLLAASEQAGAESVERIELPPLDRQEIADYVATRLQAAGYRAESPLSAAQLNDLQRLSGGNFGAIHDWLPSLFAAPAQSGAGLLGRLRGAAGSGLLKGLPLQHVAIAAGLLLVVVLLFLNRGGEPLPAEPKSTPQATSGDRDSVVLALPNRPAGNAADATAAPPSTPAAQPAPPPRPEPAQAQQAAAAKPLQARVEPPAPQQIAPQPATAQPARSQPVPVISGSQKIPLPSPQKAPTAPATAAPTTPVPAAVASAQPMPAPAAATPQAGSAAAQAASQPAPAAAQAASAVDAKSGEQTADERELLGWSNKQFALQLLGAGSAATVTKFRQQAGGAKLYTYRTDLNGKPWYIVVTGPYPSRNAATAAADALPPALRNQKPWPRAVKNIQADIKQRK